ncbi:PaaI family thioesterase [Thermovibrio ammonificans]|jgi:acyl-coenzyme A thioesterase PaaI-like protein|uniref:Thioesterase superfamily protein n=1 Tax=Thermovibrio ammonificans (strain DSM 15698 / JCM 12110 / HB-1) TaxID=648996 RepID=E8T2Z5_THEA1|nr:PaaI family thioesterase [Thermovibrio ammonificans]ADU97204.1 thioesterase superfamily protein [Thermovibrio ammonificans HB-1]
MEVKTHKLIDRSLSGEPVELGEGYSKVLLKTAPVMAADGKGLVHGGFLFSAADYAAMLAVNEPTVVLGSASVKFLRPVKVGDEVLFTAREVNREGKKRTVEVVGERSGERVFEGEFTCFVLPKHVLG